MAINHINKYSQDLDQKNNQHQVMDYLSGLGQLQICDPAIVTDKNRFAGCEAPIYITAHKTITDNWSFSVHSSDLSTLGIAYMMFDILSTCSHEEMHGLSFNDFSLITMYFSITKKRDLQVILNATQHLIGNNL
jgi:sulfur transfer protein SufE